VSSSGRRRPPRRPRACWHGDRVLGHRGRRFELLGGLWKRLLNRRRVTLVRTLHGDADDRARVEIDSVFGLVRQMRPAVFHSRDLRVRIVRMTDLVELWSIVAFGSATAVLKRYGVKPRIQDRLEAASELADRLHWLAVPAVEFDAVDPGPVFIMPPGTKIAIK
jgi:hypothetical protein